MTESQTDNGVISIADEAQPTPTPHFKIPKFVPNKARRRGTAGAFGKCRNRPGLVKTVDRTIERLIQLQRIAANQAERYGKADPKIVEELESHSK